MMTDDMMPERVSSLMTELMKNEGFQIISEYFEEKRKAVESQVLDVSTSDQETHDLKQQLAVMNTLSPSKCAETIQKKYGRRANDYVRGSAATS